MGKCLEFLTIEVKNWDDYNPRKNRAKHSWFRLENTIATDPKLFGLTVSQKFIMICIFAEASKSNNSGTAKIFINWLSEQIKVKPKEIIDTIQILIDIGILLVPGGNQLEPNGSPTLHYITLHNITNNTLHNITERKAPTSGEVIAEASLPDELIAAHPFLIERKAKGALVRGWLETFPEPEWIIGELRKADLWEQANPRKKKKDFGKFMTNWLTRGWDSRRVPTNFNKAEQRTQNNRAAAEAYMKKLEAEKQ